MSLRSALGVVSPGFGNIRGALVVSSVELQEEIGVRPRVALPRPRSEPLPDSLPHSPLGSGKLGLFLLNMGILGIF